MSELKSLLSWFLLSLILMASSGSLLITIAQDIQSSNFQFLVYNITLGFSPFSAAYDSLNGYVYVIGYGSNIISVINGTTVIANITIGDYTPWYVFSDPSNGYVYVIGLDTSSVYVINGTSVIADIPIHWGPWFGVYDPVNNYVYIVDPESNSVTVINGTSVIATIPVELLPIYAVVDTLNGFVYVMNARSYSISIINGTSVISTIQLRNSPSAGVYDPSNGYVYVISSDEGTVCVINGTSVISTIQVGNNPTNAVYNPSNGYVYVINEGSNSTTVIQGTTIISTVQVGNSPIYAIYNPFNKLVYVVNLGSNTVSLIEGTSVVETIQVGSQPKYAVYDTKDYSVYVLNSISNSISVISQKGSFYKLTFVESGLPPNTIWSVSINNGEYVNSSASNIITFYLSPGTYSFKVYTSSPYIPSPSNGTFTITNSPISISITFTLNEYTVIINVYNVNGQPASTSPGVVYGLLYTSSDNYVNTYFMNSNSQFVLKLAPGTYILYVYHYPNLYMNFTEYWGNMTFTVNGNEVLSFTRNTTWIKGITVTSGTNNVIFTVDIYNPSEQTISGTFTLYLGSPPNNVVDTITKQVTLQHGDNKFNITQQLNNGNQLMYYYGVINASYPQPKGSPIATDQWIWTQINEQFYTVTFVETGLPQGTLWSVTVNGVTKTSTSNEITFVLPEGNYEYSVTPPQGYTVTPSQGTITLNQNIQIKLQFTQLVSLTFVIKSVLLDVLKTGELQQVPIFMDLNISLYSVSFSENGIYINQLIATKIVNVTGIVYNVTITFNNLIPGYYEFVLNHPAIGTENLSGDFEGKYGGIIFVSSNEAVNLDIIAGSPNVYYFDAINLPQDLSTSWYIEYNNIMLPGYKIPNQNYVPNGWQDVTSVVPLVLAPNDGVVTVYVKSLNNEYVPFPYNEYNDEILINTTTWYPEFVANSPNDLLSVNFKEYFPYYTTYYIPIIFISQSSLNNAYTVNGWNPFDDSLSVPNWGIPSSINGNCYGIASLLILYMEHKIIFPKYSGYSINELPVGQFIFLSYSENIIPYLNPNTITPVSLFVEIHELYDPNVFSFLFNYNRLLLSSSSIEDITNYPAIIIVASGIHPTYHALVAWGYVKLNSGSYIILIQNPNDPQLLSIAYFHPIISPQISGYISFTDDTNTMQNWIVVRWISPQPAQWSWFTLYEWNFLSYFAKYLDIDSFLDTYYLVVSPNPFNVTATYDGNTYRGYWSNGEFLGIPGAAGYVDGTPQNPLYIAAIPLKYVIQVTADPQNSTNGLFIAYVTTSGNETYYKQVLINSTARVMIVTFKENQFNISTPDGGKFNVSTLIYNLNQNRSVTNQTEVTLKAGQSASINVNEISKKATVTIANLSLLLLLSFLLLPLLVGSGVILIKKSGGTNRPSLRTPSQTNVQQSLVKYTYGGAIRKNGTVKLILNSSVKAKIVSIHIERTNYVVNNVTPNELVPGENVIRGVLSSPPTNFKQGEIYNIVVVYQVGNNLYTLKVPSYFIP